MQTITIHTDGGARGNPGPAGIGVVFYNNEQSELYTISEYIGEATNNVAEYTALVRALEELPRVVTNTAQTDVTVKLDSQLAERQLNGAYKVKDATLKTYFEKVKALAESVGHISYVHVRREDNKRADELANEAMDNAQ